MVIQRVPVLHFDTRVCRLGWIENAAVAIPDILRDYFILFALKDRRSSSINLSWADSRKAAAMHIVSPMIFVDKDSSSFILLY